MTIGTETQNQGRGASKEEGYEATHLNLGHTGAEKTSLWSCDLDTQKFPPEHCRKTSEKTDVFATSDRHGGFRRQIFVIF